MRTESEKKTGVADAMNEIAPRREKYIRKNSYYYRDLISFYRFNIPEGSSVLEIGCGTGFLLNALKPKRGVGIDISSKMISEAKARYKDLTFHLMDAESLQLKEKFDYIIISDSLGYFEDIQKVFGEMKKVCNSETRIIINFHSFLWLPVLEVAQFFGMKMPQKRLNWLNRDDVAGLLAMEGFETIKEGKRFLAPVNIPLLSWFSNKILAFMPGFNRLCLTGFIIARKKEEPVNFEKKYSVSVIIPARNESGNIEPGLLRIPKMGKHTEIIYIEGGSKDNTLDEIKRVCKKYSKTHDVKYSVQEGKGKGDAVRKGFGMARCDILMILDADLTVPPEDLPKFYNAIASGRGEYINGTRLVYPMEKESMRTLNMIGNKFFSIMFSWLLGQKLKDTLCGTKVISRNNWGRLVANRKYFGEFDPFGDFDMIFGSAKMNLKIVEIPIRYQARTYGETNISRFRHGWLLLKMVAFAMNKIKFI